MRQPRFLCQLRRPHGALHHSVHGDVACIARLGQGGVGVHHLGEELLIETPPVHADANRFSRFDRDLHDRAKVIVTPFGADIARVDAVFRQRARTGGMLREQQVAVIVEVPDDGHIDFGNDGGHGACRVVGIDRHTHEFTTGCVQRTHLRGGGGHIGRIGIGHGLDDDRVRTANQNAAHADRYGGTSRTHGHEI